MRTDDKLPDRFAPATIIPVVMIQAKLFCSQPSRVWRYDHMICPHVAQVQVHAKILSADWSSDGLHLALGFIDGRVAIRDAEGVEKITITR